MSGGRLQMTRRAGLAAAAAGAALAAVSPLAGCRGDRTDKPPRRFFPDMDDQQRWDPQEETAFFEDGRTTRPVPDGTVAFGYADFDPAEHAGEPWAESFMVERSMMLAEDDAVHTGMTTLADGTQVFVDDIPVRVTRAMLERGRERFDIFCAACHGVLGQGAENQFGAGTRAPVAIRWSYTPANLHKEAYTDKANRTAKDGYLFHVTREGVWAPDGANRMPGYKHAVDVMDAWAIVAYMRALQASQAAEAESLGTPAASAGASGEGGRS